MLVAAVYLWQMLIVRRETISENDSTEHPTVSNSSSESLSDSCTSVQTSPSDPLHQILEKLTKLESLDKHFTEMQDSFDTCFTTLQSSFVTRFTEVKTTLNTRLDKVSTRMTNLEASCHL